MYDLPERPEVDTKHLLSIGTFIDSEYAKAVSYMHEL
jgi:hypothetical protein